MARTRYGHCEGCGAPIAQRALSCSHCGGELRAASERNRQDPASTRVAAGVCAILFGSMGIHKFILGQVACGFILMAIGIFTCFIVSSAIGIIEGIILLTKSDEDFEQIYLIERRPWF